MAEDDLTQITMIFIDEVQQVEEAVKILIEKEILSLTCQRHNNRSDPLDLIFIGARDWKVYVFDVTVLGARLFDAGLRGVLEKRDLVKLMFDCREDADALLKLHNTQLSGVLDVQLMEILHRRSTSSQNNPKKYQVYKLWTLKRCTRQFVQLAPSYYYRSDYHETNLWAARPVDFELITFWAKRTMHLIPLFQELKTYPTIDLDLLTEASRRSLDHVRSYLVYPADRYIQHCYLPLGILDVHSDGAVTSYQCDGCLKILPEEAFNMEPTVQKCKVCSKVDKNYGRIEEFNQD